MAKEVEHSSVAQEIRKEYLKEHLDMVRKLVETWIPRLRAPGPFSPTGNRFGWESVYSPKEEQDADISHMLRHHLKSRALWRHHADWERRMDDVWSLLSQIRQKASEGHPPPSGGEEQADIGYSNYIGTAMWIAFELALGRKVDKPYKVMDDGKGVAIGAFRITLLNVGLRKISSVEKKHWDVVERLAALDQVKELAKIWREADDIESHMQAIASKILKSNDILYPCRFCRHLWK